NVCLWILLFVSRLFEETNTHIRYLSTYVFFMIFSFLLLQNETVSLSLVHSNNCLSRFHSFSHFFFSRFRFLCILPSLSPWLLCFRSHCGTVTVRCCFVYLVSLLS